MKKFYLILLPLICFLFVNGRIESQTRDTGSINGADYLIQIPKDWNGGLVMYAHGYEEVGENTGGFKEFNDLIKVFTKRGYAYAMSAYKRQGLVIKDGIEDTEALRNYFQTKYGKPNICIITGHSMGGMITLATIEKFPLEYNGALPLCGWLEPVHSLLKHTLNMLVTYDYLFGKNNRKIVTGDENISEDMIKSNLEKKPKLEILFAEHFRLKVKDLSGIIHFYQHVFKETTKWLGGFPAGNIKTIYSGFGYKDDSLNKNIKRYKANPYAEDYFIQYYTPTGKIRHPVIALHTTHDPILPVFSYKYYNQLTQIQHTDSLYIQEYVVGNGHCNFTNEDIVKAFNQLINWIKKGVKPKRGYN